MATGRGPSTRLAGLMAQRRSDMMDHRDGGAVVGVSGAAVAALTFFLGGASVAAGQTPATKPTGGESARPFASELVADASERASLTAGPGSAGFEGGKFTISDQDKSNVLQI